MAGLRQPHRKMTADGARAENTDAHWVESPVWKGQTMGSFQQACARRNRSRCTQREDQTMITAIVRFKLPASIDAAKAAELFQGSAPKYRDLQGLVRKYYLFDAENHTGGGCYLWESREAAERVYNAEWRKMITDRYGSAPEISYFETPVIVDNAVGKTILDAAE
jgi:hypothetical protein